MIQIELPCCDAPVLLPPEAETVRCNACAIEHLLAPDARLIATDAPHEAEVTALAA